VSRHVFGDPVRGQSGDASMGALHRRWRQLRDVGGSVEARTRYAHCRRRTASHRGRSARTRDRRDLHGPLRDRNARRARAGRRTRGEVRSVGDLRRRPERTVSVAGSNPAPREVLLALDQVSKRFGATLALDDASLAVGRGSVHALLGENGAGKTTLMRIAFGLLEADQGTLRAGAVSRTTWTAGDAIAAGIGMVHQ